MRFKVAINFFILYHRRLYRGLLSDYYKTFIICFVLVTLCCSLAKALESLQTEIESYKVDKKAWDETMGIVEDTEWHRKRKRKKPPDKAEQQKLDAKQKRKLPRLISLCIYIICISNTAVCSKNFSAYYQGP